MCVMNRMITLGVLTALALPFTGTKTKLSEGEQKQEIEDLSIILEEDSRLTHPYKDRIIGWSYDGYYEDDDNVVIQDKWHAVFPEDIPMGDDWDEDLPTKRGEGTYKPGKKEKRMWYWMIETKCKRAPNTNKTKKTNTF